jgi:hypothetical protein
MQCGVGWWLFIDGMAIGKLTEGNVTSNVVNYAWLPGLGLQLAFILVNVMDFGQLDEANEHSYAPGAIAKARCALFFAMLLAFGCLGAGNELSYTSESLSN